MRCGAVLIRCRREPECVGHAFLTYTSGSHGQTKSGLHTHGNVCFKRRVFKSGCQLRSTRLLLARRPFSPLTACAHIAAAWRSVRDGDGGIASITNHCCRSSSGWLYHTWPPSRPTSSCCHPTFDQRAQAVAESSSVAATPLSADLVNRWEPPAVWYIPNALWP